MKLSIFIHQQEHLAQKAEIDQKITGTEQQKVVKDETNVPITKSNSASVYHSKQTSTPILTKQHNNDVLFNGKNTNRTVRQRRHNMAAMIANASQHNRSSNNDNIHPSDKSFKQTRFESL